MRVPSYVVRQELEGNKAMESDVLSLVNHSHDATTELFDDALVGDGLADHCWQVAGETCRLCLKASQRTRRRRPRIVAQYEARSILHVPNLFYP